MSYQDIKEYIPQRSPILMVDELVIVEGDIARTMFVVKDNELLCEDNKLTEAGLIEHIAQSASAFAGYKVVSAGATEPPVGLIGEVKNYHCYRRPDIGERLDTYITFGVTSGEVTIVTGRTLVGEELIAETKLKIAMK